MWLYFRSDRELQYRGFTAQISPVPAIRPRQNTGTVGTLAEAAPCDL